MKILSWNVNGIRAVERKGELQNLIESQQPDILCLQEIKAKEDQIEAIKTKYAGYTQYYNPAEKPGYAGTAVWVRKDAGFTDVSFGRGMPKDPADAEGRITQVSCTHNNTPYVVLGVYFPNGGKSPEAWDNKLVFYDHFLEYVDSLESEGGVCIWGGDVNCAHNEIDLARPEGNKNSIGFLPEERAWVGQCIRSGWADIFRSLNPTTVIYSWWHVISRARSRNVGWRIDYFFMQNKYIDTVKDITYLNDQMGSDHCPLVLELNPSNKN